MPKLVTFAKYSPQGAKGVFEEGMASRKKLTAELATALGGTQIGYWAVADAEWDFMILWDLPADKLATTQAVYLLTSSSGAFDAAKSYWLLEAEDVDAARASLPGYRPPGA